MVHATYQKSTDGNCRWCSVVVEPLRVVYDCGRNALANDGDGRQLVLVRDELLALGLELVSRPADK